MKGNVFTRLCQSFCIPAYTLAGGLYPSMHLRRSGVRDGVWPGWGVTGGGGVERGCRQGGVCGQGGVHFLLRWPLMRSVCILLECISVHWANSVIKCIMQHITDRQTQRPFPKQRPCSRVTKFISPLIFPQILYRIEYIDFRCKCVHHPLSR